MNAAAQAMVDKAFAVAAAKLGDTVMYSRPGKLSADGIDPFPLACLMNSSREHARPDSTNYEMVVRTADIPSGPLTGDRVEFQGSFYIVYQPGSDPEIGQSIVPLRLAPK